MDKFKAPDEICFEDCWKSVLLLKLLTITAAVLKHYEIFSPRRTVHMMHFLSLKIQCNNTMSVGWADGWIVVTTYTRLKQLFLIMLQ